MASLASPMSRHGGVRPSPRDQSQDSNQETTMGSTMKHEYKKPMDKITRIYKEQPFI